MTITFRCEKCHNKVEAPGSAAGKRGKCPHCGASSYIPAPVKAEDIIPLSPVDEAEERSHQEEIKTLMEKERDLIHETGGEPETPLEHREDLSSEDLRHLVVNFCMDRFNGNVERAEEAIHKLKQFKFTAIEAVEDFEKGKAVEPVLDIVPKKLIHAFLKDLKEHLKS